jgi:hypothetical protein
MAEGFEAMRRNPVAGLLVCTPTDTLVNEVAYVGFKLVDFRPA